MDFPHAGIQMNTAKHTQGDNAARDVDLLRDVEFRRIAPCASISRHFAASIVGWHFICDVETQGSGSHGDF